MAKSKSGSGLSSAPAEIRLSLSLISRQVNNLVLLGSDYAADKIAQSTTGNEVSQINENPDQRKELDAALAEVLHYYLGSNLGPGIAYLVTLSATLASRYEFEPIDVDADESEESEGSKEDEQSERSASGEDGSTDGKTSPREDDSPKANTRKRSAKKKATRQKRASANAS